MTDPSIVPPAGAFRFELKNDLTEIATLAAAMDDFCARNAIGEDVKAVVSLALEEVVTSIIENGSVEGGECRLRIDLAVDGGALIARVEDDARGCDLAGIQLVETLVDAVTSVRERGRNLLLLRMSTTASPPAR